MQKLLHIFGLVLLLASCSTHEEIDSPTVELPELSDVAIAYRVTSDPSFAARDSRGTLIGGLGATRPNDDDGHQDWTTPWVQDDAMTVNAHYYFDSMTMLGQKFLGGQEVVYNDNDDDDDNPSTSSGQAHTGEWTYSPVKYWPQQGYLDFFAQYPSDEMLRNMRMTVEYATPDDGLTLPGDMVEGDLTETAAPSNRRGAAAPTRTEASLPTGISSLRFYHESPLDTVISFRLRQIASSIIAPSPTAEGIPNAAPVVEFNDAVHQPDLMYAHHPHLSKPSVGTTVDYSFTHVMMGVRFWLKGLDRPSDDGNTDGGTDAMAAAATPSASRQGGGVPAREPAPEPEYVGSRFKNVSDFTINSISFGPVYAAGECVAYDNTDWGSYYTALDAATQHSTVPVKLRYVWKYGDAAPAYRVFHADGTADDYTMAPPFGGCERRTPYGGAPAPAYVDAAYPLTPMTDIYTQRCDYSLTHYTGTGAFSATAAKTDGGWQPAQSTPILPVLDFSRNASRDHSAFIIPPQAFLAGNPYVRVTYTIAEAVDGDATPETISFTTETVAIPMDGAMINVEDGEILDIYFTFDVDGDDYFKFIIDAKVNPWQYGGQQDETWTNW